RSSSSPASASSPRTSATRLKRRAARSATSMSRSRNVCARRTDRAAPDSAPSVDVDGTSLVSDERGSLYAEYIVVLAVFGVTIGAAFITLGPSVLEFFQQAQT